MKRFSWLWFLPAILICVQLHAAAPYKAGTTREYNLRHDRLNRSYLLHLPPQYNGSTPLPVVFFFHGGFGNGKQASQQYGWLEKSDAEGFIAVFPDGIRVTWDAMHCCGYALRAEVDDVGFVKALVEHLSSKLPIDSKRVYATGISNGAMLSYRLAAELPQIFAAIGPVAGSIGGQEDVNSPVKRVPEPASPVPVVIVHGKKDINVLYDGGQSQGVNSARIDLSVAEAVAFWTKVNGSAVAPQTEKLWGGEVINDFYASANGADVELYTVVNGIHAWPGGKGLLRRPPSQPTFSGTDTIWEFFKAHPKK